MEPDNFFVPPSSLDGPLSSTLSLGDQELRLALAAQRDRALGYLVAALAGLAANRLGVLAVYYPAVLALLALGLGSALVLARRARRRYRSTGRVDRSIAPWLIFDVLVITAMVPATGGIASPWWLWYLACAGCASLQLGRRFAIGGAVGTAFLYIGVLVAGGDIRGLDHNLYLAALRLVFLGAAASTVLVHTLDLRHSLKTIRGLKKEVDCRARDLQRLNGELQTMSALLSDIRLTDSLTGLRNRRYFQEKIADEAARLGRWNSGDRRTRVGTIGAGFLLFGLDRLEALRALHGAGAADLALKHVARRLLGSVRAEDTVIRWGAEEFLVYLPQIENGLIPTVAEKLATALRSRAFQVEETTVIALSVAVGTAFLDPIARTRGGRAWDDAIARAEASLVAGRQTAWAIPQAAIA